MRVRTFCGFAAVLAVLVASCSGESGDNSSTTVSTTPQSTSTTPPPTSTTPPSTSTTPPAPVDSYGVPITATTVPGPVFESLDELVDHRYAGGLGAVIVGVFEESSSAVAGTGEDGDGRPVDGDRPWQTASLGKVFTAVAVLHLVDEGLVELDAPVADYVDFPMSDQITVRHVMQHRSNIRDMRPVDCPDQSTVDEIKELAGIPTAPSENSDYANINYVVLGQMIGSVTGEDPGDYIRDSVFVPLGMENTYWYQSQEGPSPWWRKPESTQGVGLYDCGQLGPTIGTDGAAVTTVTDMGAFYRGLFGGALLEDETLDAMLDMDTLVFGLGYGLGIGDLTDEAFPDNNFYGFGGDGGFYGTMAFHDPEKKRTVAMFFTQGDRMNILWDLVAWANQQTDP